MRGFSVEFWNNQATLKPKVTQGLFRANYFHSVFPNFYRLCLPHIRVLKTDLWNESVATERQVLTDYPSGFGVDISSLVCRKAHEQLDEAHVTQADIRSLPYKPRSFHVILDVSTLDHIPQNDALTVIDEYARVLSFVSVLILVFAQTTPFARQYWSNRFEGVYLLESKAILERVQTHFWIVEDRGFDFLSFFMGLLPYRLLERLIWHLQPCVQSAFLFALACLERSVLAEWTKSYCGLRLVIAVKKMRVLSSEAFYNRDNQQNFKSYGSGFHAERNKRFAKLILSYNPSNIFEIGGCEADLATRILQKKPELQYTWTDFSTVAIENAKTKFRDKPNVTVIQVDANNLTSKDFKGHSCVISTILEHVEHDLTLLEQVPFGVHVFLSLPNFNWRGHFRHFNSPDDIRAYYSMLGIKQIETYTPKTCFATVFTTFLKLNLPKWVLRALRKCGFLRLPVSKNRLVFFNVVATRNSQVGLNEVICHV